MARPRLLLTLLLALVAGLLSATPALAGGVLSVDGTTLVYAGDEAEPSNVMFDLDEDTGTITVTENGSRIALDATALAVPAPVRPDTDRPDTDRTVPPTGVPPTTPETTTPVPPTTTPDATTPDRATLPVQVAPACTLDAERYVARCAARGIERIRVTIGSNGSDVRIRADLPSEIRGGAGDDLLIGGPNRDVIDGGRGKDVIGGGGGADDLRGGSDDDLLTYIDRIARDGELLARRGGVTVRPGTRAGSGSRGEGDTVFRDFEQFEGGANNDRFELRDGVAQQVTCSAGRDVAVIDSLDDTAIDCESSEVGAASGQRITTPVLVFPFPGRDDSNRSSVRVVGQVPLQGSAIVVKVRCQVAIGLLAADGPGCSGRVRMTRAGGTEMGTRTIELARGAETTWRIPLTSSLALARRAGGLPVTVTATPTRGAGVRRDLLFTARG